MTYPTLAAERGRLVKLHLHDGKPLAEFEAAVLPLLSERNAA